MVFAPTIGGGIFYFRDERKNMSERLAILKKITDKINREARKDNPESELIAFVAAGNENLLDFGLIPTGNIAVDEALGGGFPRGTIAQLIGNEGTGKTCLAMDIIAHNQKIAKEKGDIFIAVYLHLEARAFPFLPAINADVDFESFYIINALSSGEKSFDTLMKYLWNWEKRTALNCVDMIVIDSVTAAEPEAELKSAEESLANATVGRHAAMMSKLLRILSGSGALGKSLLLLINQYRTDITSKGDPRVATGGKAMGYYPKISITISKPADGRLYRGPKSNQDYYGHTVKGMIDKNNTQVGKPYAKFEYPVIYGQGVDLVNPTIDLAIKKGIIDQTSPGRFDLNYNGEIQKIHGRDSLEAIVRGDTELFAAIQTTIVECLNETTETNAPSSISDSTEESEITSAIDSTEEGNESFRSEDRAETYR